MTKTAYARRGFGAIAAAGLISLTLPAAPALAQKTKTKPATEAAQPAPAVDFIVSIPTIDAVGSSIDDARLRDILSGQLAENADALATLDATSITIPEIVLNVRSTSGDRQLETAMTFSNLALENVVDGVAASIDLGGIAMQSEEASFTFGPLSAANFDIGGMLGVYGLVDAGGQTELQPIYSDFRAQGGMLEAEDVSCAIGGASGAEFKARPLKTSFVEMIAIAQTLEDEGETPDPATMGKILRMYADIFTAFETSEITFGGFECEGTDDEGRPMTMAVDGMTMAGMVPGIYPALSVDGFRIDVEGDGNFALDNFTFKQMDLSTVIATLQNAPDAVDEAWLEANIRGLIPAMEGLSLAGLDIDIPDPDTEDGRIKATIGAFDLSLGAYRNGIPTDLDTSAAHIVVDLPTDSSDEQIQQLLALGITDVDAGFRVAAAWNEAEQAIDVEEVSLSGVDLATVLLAGRIANATEALFATDPDTALMASMGMAVKSLDLTVTDAGLADLVITAVSAGQGVDPATLRPVYAGLAEGTVIGMLAGAADAANLGKAINAFVAGTAKTLNIGIVAKTDPGLGMADFAAAEDDPTLLLGKVDISATAR